MAENISHLDGVIALRSMHFSDIDLVKQLLIDGGLPGAAVMITKFLTFSPNGFFVAIDSSKNDKLVGCLGGIPYRAGGPSADNRSAANFAYVAAMVVLPEYRGQGVAVKLMHAVLSFLSDGGVCHVWLQATALGEPLYRTFGFRERGVSFFASPIAVDAASLVRKDDHVQKQSQSEHAASLIGIQIRGATVKDLEEVARLDCKAYGYCRVCLLVHIAAALDRCIVAVENASERVVGYVVCWPHSVGPLISDAGTNVAGVLFQAALEQFQKEHSSGPSMPFLFLTQRGSDCLPMNQYPAMNHLKLKVMSMTIGPIDQKNSSVAATPGANLESDKYGADVHTSCRSVFGAEAELEALPESAFIPLAHANHIYAMLSPGTG